MYREVKRISLSVLTGRSDEIANARPAEHPRASGCGTLRSKEDIRFKTFSYININADANLFLSRASLSCNGEHIMNHLFTWKYKKRNAGREEKLPRSPDLIPPDEKLSNSLLFRERSSNVGN